MGRRSGGGRAEVGRRSGGGRAELALVLGRRERRGEGIEELGGDTLNGEAVDAGAQHAHHLECVARLARQRAVDREDQVDEAFSHLGLDALLPVERGRTRDAQGEPSRWGRPEARSSGRHRPPRCPGGALGGVGARRAFRWSREAEGARSSGRAGGLSDEPGAPSCRSRSRPAVRPGSRRRRRGCQGAWWRWKRRILNFGTARGGLLGPPRASKRRHRERPSGSGGALRCVGATWALRATRRAGGGLPLGRADGPVHQPGCGSQWKKPWRQSCSRYDVVSVFEMCTCGHEPSVGRQRPRGGRRRRRAASGGRAGGGGGGGGEGGGGDSGGEGGGGDGGDGEGWWRSGPDRSHAPRASLGR